MTDRPPIDVTLSGGPGDGRRLTYKPVGSPDVILYAASPTFEEMAAEIANPDPAEPAPFRVAEYRLAWGEWLDLDEATAFQRGLPPGRILLRGVWEFHGIR